MKMQSQAFENGETIPMRHARRGDNVSPPLTFRDVPHDARSLVLIMDDPDAPRGTFTHWVIFNLDPALRQLPEDTVPQDARQATNGWGEACYGGPQPPDREHRYFFRLYALDTTLALENGANREEVESAMSGHVLAEAELMGRYAPEGEMAERRKR